MQTDDFKKIKNELQSNPTVSTSKRHFKRKRCKTYRALWKNNLKRVHIIERLKFAVLYILWTIEQWKKVIFTDETIIQNHSNKTYIRCKPELQFNVNRYSKKSVKRISVNIWGFINFHKSKLFKISKNINRTEIFELLSICDMLDYIKYAVPGQLYFQQDNSNFFIKWVFH